MLFNKMVIFNLYFHETKTINTTYYNKKYVKDKKCE